MAAVETGSESAFKGFSNGLYCGHYNSKNESLQDLTKNL